MNTTFNNLISLECPEGFRELSKEENKNYFLGNLLRLSFQNSEKHILLSLSKSRDSVFNRFISVPTIINSSLSNLERNLKEYNYIEEVESTIFGEPAITECFSYTANDKDVKQYGELSIFKYKKSFYVIYCICRLDDKENSKELFKQFKDSFISIESKKN